MTNTVCITGANRGLGLEFTKQYAMSGWQVLACCKDLINAQELKALATQFSNITCYALDVTDEGSIHAVKEAISSPIDVLINNAGFLVHDELNDVSQDVLLKTFMINTVGPLQMLKAFKDKIAMSKLKLIANISSSMGSISDNSSGGYYSYRASKAALNMIMKSAAIDLANEGIAVLLLHPGWVKTRMGGDQAAIEAPVSVKGMRTVIENYKPNKGEVKFIRYNGEIVPW